MPLQFCRIEPLPAPDSIVQPGWYAFIREDRIVFTIRLTEPTPKADLIAAVRSAVSTALAA